MKKFEYKLKTTGSHIPAETIEAYEYDLDTKNGKLTFTDENGDQIASFAIESGAYVKRLGK
jgi:hypothetical protein